MGKVWDHSSCVWHQVDAEQCGGWVPWWVQEVLSEFIIHQALHHQSRLQMIASTPLDHTHYQLCGRYVLAVGLHLHTSTSCLLYSGKFSLVQNFAKMYSLQNKFSRLLFLRKQDAAIDHTFECHASLLSLHINEKLTRLPTSLRQGISLLRTVDSYPCRFGSLSPSPQKKTTKTISSVILLLFVFTQGASNVHRAAKLAQSRDPQRS